MAKLHHYYSSTPVSEKYLGWFSERIDFRLLSCHDGYFNNGKKWCRYYERRENPVKQTLLLDSGAFTAWNKGHPAKLDDLLPKYAWFLEHHLQDVENIWLINLDKIPAEPGRDPTPADLSEAIEESDKNFNILVREFGARVMPVFHQGEDDARLAEVAAMSEYICVSPRNDLGEQLRVQWSAETHRKLPKGIKTHGLAATGEKMMTQVPWTSVDSASLMFYASAGHVRLCLGGRLLMVTLSEKSELRKERGKHYDTFAASEQKRLADHVGRWGFTVDELRTSWESRACLTLLETNDWLDNHHRFDLYNQVTLF